MSAIEERVARLERENRRLKGSMLVLALLMVSLFVMGQTYRPGVIEASRFVVRGPAGQIVASLGTYEGEPTDGSGSFGLYYADGGLKLNFWAGTDGRSPNLTLFAPRDANGSQSLLWSARPFP